MDGVCNAFAGQIRTRIWLHLSYLLTLERSHGLKNGKSHFLNFICKTTFYVVHAHSQLIHLNFVFVQCSMTYLSLLVTALNVSIPDTTNLTAFSLPPPIAHLIGYLALISKQDLGKYFVILLSCYSSWQCIAHCRTKISCKYLKTR